MKEFDITITETLEKTVTVKAESQEEAEDLVHDQWSQSIHVLDADNFTGATIKTSATREIEEVSKLTVLLIEPMKPPSVVEISSDLDSLQKAVGGYIETAHFFNDPIEIICNEEGKIHNLPLNRAIYNEEGNIVEVIAGTFLIVGDGEEDFENLSPAMIEKYCDLFDRPEKFVKLAGQILVQKMDLPKDKDITKSTDQER